MAAPTAAEPRWIAVLESGETVVGRPSWLSKGDSDWRILKSRFERNGGVLKRLSLWVPPWGLFPAPEGKGGYGYYESVSQTVMTRRGGVEAVSICWPEKDTTGSYIKAMSIKAGGVVEYWRRSKWLPCMIGEEQADRAVKDLGVWWLRI